MTDNDIYCIGCGELLQHDDESKPGYVDPRALNREFVLCKRCFQLQHYGKFTKAVVNNDPIKLINSKAKIDDLVILVVDVSLSICKLDQAINKLSRYKNLIVVATRYDIYKDYIKIDKAYNFLKREFKKTKLKIKDIFIVDDNIDEIFDYIDNMTIDNDAYLVGYENVGKTTFINKLLKHIASEDKNFITASKYPGTTIQLVPIGLGDNTFIYDSPGISSPGNMLHFLSDEFIKNQGLDNKITSFGYQLNENNALIVSNTLVFEYLSGKKQGIVLYGSSLYEITRCKVDNVTSTYKNQIPYLKLKDDKYDDIDDLEPVEFNIVGEGKYDLVIEGFCFISVGAGKYRIYVPKGTNIFKRKAMI